MKAESIDTQEYGSGAWPRETLTTEQRILDAAEKEFLEKGFAGARTSSIAEAAGVTHALLHYYFRTKTKLFEKIINDKMSFLGELMLSSFEYSDKPLLEKIKVAIERHLDFISVNPKLPLFFIREVYTDPERIKIFTDALNAHARKTIRDLQRQIDEAAARGECRRVRADMLMLDIVSLNVFSFISQPILDVVLPDVVRDREHFLERRKHENFDTIMRKLKI